MTSKGGVAGPVYTVCDESRYLIVRNVPALGCVNELISLFGQYGPIEEYRLMDEEDSEPFADVCWIKFVNISNARFAKRKLDEYQFFGNLLKVTYAPEHESSLDMKEKLDERKHVVLSKINSCKSKSLGPPLLPHIPNMGPVLQGADQSSGIQPTSSSSTKSGQGVPGQHITIPTQLSTKRKNCISSSMTAVAQSVRVKLDQISSVGRLPKSEDSGAMPFNMVNEENVGQDGMSTEGKEKHVSNKRPRLDNRRRI